MHWIPVSLDHRVEDMAVYALVVLSPAIVVVCQTLLKIGANRFGRDIWWRQYINPPVIIAYLLYLAVTVINVRLFALLPLAVGTVLVALSYIGVALSGRFFLGESLTFRQVRGIVICVVGMLLYAVGM